MDLYYNHLIDLLVKNFGIKPLELYEISGFESKREFLNEINRLISEHRIIKEYGVENCRFIYAPKVLSLYEQEKCAEFKETIHVINFLPTKVLEKELEYVNNGTEQEDCLEFELQITGYKVGVKHKAFLEEHTGLSLDFEKYHYFLWSRFLYPFYPEPYFKS